jgi:hypothetical protein
MSENPVRRVPITPEVALAALEALADAAKVQRAGSEHHKPCPFNICC